MTLDTKKNAFVKLGKFLSQFKEGNCTKDETVFGNDLFFEKFIDLMQLSQSHNGWYTPEQVYFSIQSWADALTEENLSQWLSNYNFSEVNSKKVALILAGNIPLVGFHDFLSVLITGHDVLVKTSSNDQHLLPFLANYLIAFEPEFKNKITFVEGKLEGFDAGADDYLVKPFEFKELLARIKTLLKRTIKGFSATSTLRIGDLEMNLDSKEVFRAGNKILLTAKEFQLLEYLIRDFA